MKKFAAFFAVVALLAVAAPVFAATNPFMDVPMNSWAYDAVAQLASKGILSGYPDGLFKGKQPITRYETASVIARALAYVDMTKASKQDVDMLKRLVIEFKDELDALGVRADALDADVAKLKSDIGGWKISGRIRLDVEHRSYTAQDLSLDDSMGNVQMSDGLINFQRFFGEDGQAMFHMRLRWRPNGDGDDDSINSDLITNGQFYARVPFFYDSFLTVGFTGDDDIDARFGFWPDVNARYFSSVGLFNDNTKYMIKWTKAFEFGDVFLSLAHPAGFAGYSPQGHAWEVVGNVNFNLNEQFGFGLGGQYLSYDDWAAESNDPANHDTGWDSIFTGWAGVDFNFMQGVALHGLVYFQSKSGEFANEYDESANAYRLALDVNQDVLKFTSFYAEYGKVDQYFRASNGGVAYSMFMFSDRDIVRSPGIPSGLFGGAMAADDITYFNVGAAQQWTDQIRTWLFYGNASMETGNQDFGLRQYMVGVDYVYNPYTVFTLSYMKYDGTDQYDGLDYGRFRFSTQVNF